MVAEVTGASVDCPVSARMVLEPYPTPARPATTPAPTACPRAARRESRELRALASAAGCPGLMADPLISASVKLPAQREHRWHALTLRGSAPAHIGQLAELVASDRGGFSPEGRRWQSAGWLIAATYRDRARQCHARPPCESPRSGCDAALVVQAPEVGAQPSWSLNLQPGARHEYRTPDLHSRMTCWAKTVRVSGEHKSRRHHFCERCR